MNIHNNIRIIQISDCHLSSDDQQQWFNRHPDQYLERVIHYINNYEHDASVILATGDLSHDGSEKSYVKLAEYFSQLKNKVYAIAGNHDDSHNMDKYLNLVSHFTKDNWLFLMLDTHVTSEEYGMLSQQALAYADEILSKHPDKYIFISMHHPAIHIDCAWIDKINLLNSQDFMALVSHHNNIKAITSGHVHQSHELIIDGVAFFTCPSSCHQYLSHSNDFAVDEVAAGYRWFNLQANGKVISGVTRVTDNPHVT